MAKRKHGFNDPVESYGYIDYAKLAEKLRDELSDVNRDIIGEKGLIVKYSPFETAPTTTIERKYYNCKKFYNTFLYDYTPGVPIKEYLVDTDDYWTDDGYTIPSGYYASITTYSKASLMYPFLHFYGKLPDLTNYPSGTEVWFGFANGESPYTGIAAFMWRVGPYMFVQYGGLVQAQQNVTARLPSNPTGSWNQYYIKVCRWGAEFYINDYLVAVMLDVPEYFRRLVINCPPYAINIAQGVCMKRLHAFLKIKFPLDKSKPNPGSLTFPVSPSWFQWGEDDPNPPRARQLYQANSTNTFRGATISSGSLTSHPIPVYGYPAWELIMDADQDFTVRIDYLGFGGNFRTFDTYSSPSGTHRLHLLVDEPMILARVTVTPSAYPMTINEAFAVLIPGGE